MISQDQAQEVLGGTVIGSDGQKIGKVAQLYLDNQTGEPEWVTVKTGLFGSAESFAPLAQAETRDGDVHVPFDKDLVKNAPQVEADGALSPDEEAELYRYYGYTQQDVQPEDGQTGNETVGRDTSGPTTDDAMTRSEEQLNVGTERRESGRARLRKYVVTENVTQTVPVSHEEVRVEREDITDANRDQAMSGGEITDEEHEVTLHEERAVVGKETVPVERVSMGTETVTGEEQVSEEVRKEQIETDGVDGKTTR